MVDCVLAADGWSYERCAMARHLQDSSISPVTGQPMRHKRLLQNVCIKQAILMCYGD